MKNLALLIDTNVILNYLLKRDDNQLDESTTIMLKCANGEFKGYIAFHTLSTLWYVLRKKEDYIRRAYLKAICEIFTVACASQTEIIKAIENNKFSDFEDCLQDKCAKDVNADFIVTCNINDYNNSEIEAITPKQLLKKIQY